MTSHDSKDGGTLRTDLKDLVIVTMTSRALKDGVTLRKDLVSIT